MKIESTGSGWWLGLGRLTVALSWFEGNWHLSVAWTQPVEK